jgi:hypothetical protein
MSNFFIYDDLCQHIGIPTAGEYGLKGDSRKDGLGAGEGIVAGSIFKAVQQVTDIAFENVA